MPNPTQTLDCRGLSCPEPVILTKKAIASGPQTIKVLVDQRAPLENVTRFLIAMKYKVSSQEQDGQWTITATK